MVELRWILLGIGIAAIGLIWWWTARRSAQAPGNAALREPTAGPLHTFGAAAGDGGPPSEKRAHAPELRDRSVPPLEPLTIRAAEFDGVPDLDEPMLAVPKPLDLPVELPSKRAEAPPPTPGAPPRTSAARSAPSPAVRSAEASSPAASPQSALAKPAAPGSKLGPGSLGPGAPPPGAPVLPGAPVPGAPVPGAPNGERFAAAAPQTPNTTETQRIVSLRVCPVGESRWPGSALMKQLEAHGLAHGRYQVYHRKHVDGRSIFCVASLVEPGTFDLARMGEQEFRGVTLFAVLPGPLEPVQALDAMLATARDLARELSGLVQDDRGIPFSPQRAASMREDVARFQAQLHAAASP